NPSDTSWDAHPINYPFVELEYPHTDSTEKFILLVPKSDDNYNPIMDVRRTLETF
ncbi:hypothetical protein B0H12DRAFT_966236, partial [Mycena haematopus]